MASGGGIVQTEEEFLERVRSGLRASPIGQVIVERYLERLAGSRVRGHARCRRDVHLRSARWRTSTRWAYIPATRSSSRRSRRFPTRHTSACVSAALDIIRALGVEGGCNVQFALSPDHAEYAVIEVNPRVSRSSALASKATGYPIARVAAQIAVGRHLDEIRNAVTGKTVAAFEPALDYVVVKLPRFPFDKFPGAERGLGSQMKATGEVMAIERNFGAALNKALRGMEQAGAGWLSEQSDWATELAQLTTEPMSSACASFLAPSDQRLWRLIALLRRGVSGDTHPGGDGHRAVVRRRARAADVDRAAIAGCRVGA